MKIELQTPFGTVDCNVWHHHDKSSAVVIGAVKINSVEYHCRYEVWLDGEWKEKHLSLDRRDRKEVPFNFNARTKFKKTVLPLIATAVTPLVIAQAKEENRLLRITNIQTEIADLEQKLADKRTELGGLILGAPS